MKISVEQIQQIVSEVTKIKISEINSPSRKANIVQARHLSMHFCRWYTNLPMKTIAKLHNRDNHATVIHADSCISNDIKNNRLLNVVYEQIKLKIKSI